jgi:monothiol glutaredoxin
MMTIMFANMTLVINGNDPRRASAIHSVRTIVLVARPDPTTGNASMLRSSDGGDVQARIAETIKTHRIALFMKGSPARPQCGFSAAVVNVLRQHDVTVHAVDVLPDPELREGIKTFANWPTIPQLYVEGVFVGGCDIVREMHGTGELAQILAARVGAAS